LAKAGYHTCILCSLSKDFNQSASDNYPDSGRISNVTEWAKKPNCWDKARELDIELPEDLENELVSPGETRIRKKEAKKTQEIDNTVKAQTRVVELGHNFWKTGYGVVS
jgi:hypothetical protein